LKELLNASLSGRNFRFDDKSPATYSLKFDDQEVIAGGPGSRQSPIPLKLKETDTTSYKMSVALQSSDTYKFVYPVTVKVLLNGGPLEGAIHWQSEEKPLEYTLKSDGEVANFNLTATGKCDEVNRQDGSCVDYAYVQIWNNGATRPSAKKRFYLRVKTQP
jgi:hypothetical protein